MYICKDVFVYICINVYMYICISVYMYECKNVENVNMFIYSYKSICV